MPEPGVVRSWEHEGEVGKHADSSAAEGANHAFHSGSMFSRGRVGCFDAHFAKGGTDGLKNFFTIGVNTGDTVVVGIVP